MRAGTGDLRYYHRTQQYSVTALTDSSGNVTERYAYTAYGEVSVFDGAGAALTNSADNNRYTYTGREWDEALGLYHFRARMYDSASGRFLGRDPIGAIDGLNFYIAYFGLSYMDPSGNEIVTGPFDDGGGLADPNNPIDPIGTKPRIILPRTPSVNQESLGEGMVLVGFPRGAITPDEATACCKNVAKNIGKNGWVMCCNQEKITCAYIKKTGSIQADAIIAKCIDKHEEEHFDDVFNCHDRSDCYEPGWWLERHEQKERNKRECEAYEAQLRCMRRRLNSCQNQECKDAVQDAIDAYKKSGEKRHGCTNLDVKK